MDDLYLNTGLKMSIIDLKGRVLVDVGWQDICTRFHRAHTVTCERCREKHVEPGLDILALRVGRKKAFAHEPDRLQGQRQGLV